MYFRKLVLNNYRNFKIGELQLHVPGNDGEPYANLNLLMGNNGSGKTTLLRALALGLIPELMPRFNPAYLIRRTGKTLAEKEASVHIEGVFGSHNETFTKTTTIDAKRGLEADTSLESDSIYEEHNPEFFCVGYGASRWSPVSTSHDVPEARNTKNHVRYQRVASLFEDNFALMPLDTWIPRLMFQNPQLFGKVAHFLQEIVSPDLGQIHFLEGGEGILFETPNGANVPFNNLSDGYRSYLSWICDLTYHIFQVCGLDIKPNDLRGAVLIDEVDLHLHPKWQRRILQDLSSKFPNLQFVATTHSPLVAGTLPAKNIFLIGQDEDGFPIISHPEREIHGLDADQILQTPLFGLDSSRAPDYQDKHRELFDKAMRGDQQAALELMGIQAEGLSNSKDDPVFTS